MNNVIIGTFGKAKSATTISKKYATAIARGKRVGLCNEIEAHLKQADVYIEVGNEAGDQASKFIANGFAQEEIKKANALQLELDEIK